MTTALRQQFDRYVATGNSRLLEDIMMALTQNDRQFRILFDRQVPAKFRTTAVEAKGLPDGTKVGAYVNARLFFDLEHLFECKEPIDLTVACNNLSRKSAVSLMCDEVSHLAEHSLMPVYGWSVEQWKAAGGLARHDACKSVDPWTKVCRGHHGKNWHYAFGIMMGRALKADLPVLGQLSSGFDHTCNPVFLVDTMSQDIKRTMHLSLNDAMRVKPTQEFENFWNESTKHLSPKVKPSPATSTQADRKRQSSLHAKLRYSHMQRMNGITAEDTSARRSEIERYHRELESNGIS